MKFAFRFSSNLTLKTAYVYLCNISLCKLCLIKFLNSRLETSEDNLLIQFYIKQAKFSKYNMEHQMRMKKSFFQISTFARKHV